VYVLFYSVCIATRTYTHTVVRLFCLFSSSLSRLNFTKMMPLRKLSFFLALGLILLLLCLMLPVQVASQELEELDLSSKENGKLRGGMVGSTEELEHSSSIADGLSSSFAMIMVSELGDETFIIAAIMAMRHSRQIVLAGALSALYIMTVLSTALGYIVPNLIDKSTAANLATGLYIFFGFRLFYIAYYADESETEEEIVCVYLMMYSILLL